MNELLLVSIGALGAVLGSAVSGIATYNAAKVGFRRQQREKQLLTALEDLQFMKEVEETLLHRLSETEAVSKKTLKRQVRQGVQELYGRPLSPSAENQRLKHALESLRRDF